MGEQFSVAAAQAWWLNSLTPSKPQTLHATVETLLYTGLNTAHYTLHTISLSLHKARYRINTAFTALYTEHCKLLIKDQVYLGKVYMQNDPPRPSLFKSFESKRALEPPPSSHLWTLWTLDSPLPSNTFHTLYTDIYLCWRERLINFRYGLVWWYSRVWWSSWTPC